MRKNLTNARKNKELTQAQVADSIGISHRHYQRLEAGSSNGSIKIWNELKNILNVDKIDDLIQQDSNK